MLAIAQFVTLTQGEQKPSPLRSEKWHSWPCWISMVLASPIPVTELSLLLCFCCFLFYSHTKQTNRLLRVRIQFAVDTFDHLTSLTRLHTNRKSHWSGGSKSNCPCCHRADPAESARSRRCVQLRCYIGGLHNTPRSWQWQWLMRLDRMMRNAQQTRTIITQVMTWKKRGQKRLHLCSGHWSSWKSSTSAASCSPQAVQLLFKLFGWISLMHVLKRSCSFVSSLFAICIARWY